MADTPKETAEELREQLTADLLGPGGRNLSEAVMNLFRRQNALQDWIEELAEELEG